MLRPVIEINVQQDLIKSCCIFVSVAGDVATEFNGIMALLETHELPSKARSILK